MPWQELSGPATASGIPTYEIGGRSCLPAALNAIRFAAVVLWSAQIEITSKDHIKSEKSRRW